MDIASAARRGHPLIAVDVYPGGDVAAIAARIREVLPDADVIDVEDAAAADLEVIDALIARNLTDDRVFGVMSHFTVDEFYDADRLAALQRRVEERTRPDRPRRLGRRPRGRSSRGRARARRPRPLGDPAAAARGCTELARRQRRRGHPAQVQARLLRRVAHRRPAQAHPVRPDRPARRRQRRARRGRRRARRGLPRGARRRDRPPRSASSRSSTPASGAASG